MKADVQTLPAFVGVDLPGQGYAVYRINKITQAGPDAGRSAEIGKQVETVLGSEGLFNFVNQLKLNGKAKVIKPFTSDKAAS